MTETADRSTIAANDAAAERMSLEPERVLADAGACAALAELVQGLRSLGYDGSQTFVPKPGARTERSATTIVALTRGEQVTHRDAVDALGTEAVNALLQVHALARRDGGLGLTTKVVAMRSLFTFLPYPQPGRDTVYLGPDSLALFEIVWASCGHGDRAVDLATGNGFIAAALATRYDHVVAADISRRCVWTAALIPVVNRHLRCRFAAVQLDVADGLRAGAFDLVTANTPWVPEIVGPDGGPPRRFAAGGPTGFELPRRFIDAAAELLAPGGRAFVACLDIAFDDGRHPLRDHLSLLRAQDVTATILATRLNASFDYCRWARHKTGGASFAQHVVVELRRHS